MKYKEYMDHSIRFLVAMGKGLYMLYDVIVGTIGGFILAVFANTNKFLANLISGFFRKKMSGWAIPVHLLVVMFLFNLIIYMLNIRFLPLSVLQSTTVVISISATIHGWWTTYRRAKKAGL
jgi:hypothetical protein